MSEIEEQRFQHMCGNGQRLMIIELRKYNSAEELLIGFMNTGSWGRVIYWNMEQRVSVSKVAVHMRETGMGPCTGYRGAYN